MIKDYSKITKTDNNIKFKPKIRGIKNSINKDIFNKINSNSFKNKPKTNFINTKKEKNIDYYNQNNSLNHFRHNSFLGRTLFSTKNNIEYSTNSKTNNSNKNIFSPVLINRVNSNRLKLLQKSNKTNNDSNNLTNYKKIKRNIKNKLYEFNNSLSTNYKEKQNNKDKEESSINLCFKNIGNKNFDIIKTITDNKKNTNNLFLKNRKILKINNIRKNLQKNNNSLNYLADINIKSGINDKKAINNYNNILKKSNNHILENISFNNYISEKPINDNNYIKITYNGNKKLNSPTNQIINNNNDVVNLNRKLRQNDNIKKSSLFSIIKEDNKPNNNKNENKLKEYSCLNIINECFEQKNKKENNNNNRNKNYKYEKLDTSFESLSDSKLYELAKSYIPKEENLDRGEMEQILKYKKIISKK